MSLSNGILYSAAPPDGYIPDFNRPHEAHTLLVCTIIFLALAVVATAIRTYTRARIVCLVALDDYIMIIAMLLSIALSGFVLNMFNFGMGKHLYDVPLNKLSPHFLFNNLLAAIFFCAATGFAKTSILLFYIRIFPSRTFKFVVWTLAAFTIAYSASSVLVNIFSCTPIARSWDVLIVSGSCINRPIFYFVQAGLGIFTDFATLLTPLYSMRKLQLPTRQKIGIAIILIIGAFVSIVSIIRLSSLYVLLKSTDLTMDTPTALMWCVVELNFSIVGGCVPTLKPFLRQFTPKLIGYSAYDTNDASADRNRSGSHQLKSFDPRNNDTVFTKSTTTTAGSRPYGDGESEEYIIQSGAVMDNENLGRVKGANNIVRTVEYGYDEHKGRP